MNAQDIGQIEKELAVVLPERVRSFFLQMDLQVPARAFSERDLLRLPSEIVALNRRLRGKGYYHLPWFPHFLAVGSDPGDCIYYFDLGRSACPVLFADHDYDDIDEYSELAADPDGFVAYLRSMVSRLEDEERPKNA